MKYLFLCFPLFLFANSPQQIVYGEKTEISNGFVIYADKEASGDISMLKTISAKEVKKVDMPSSYKSCISCHGSLGEKRAVGKVSFLAGQNKIRLMKKLAAYRHGTYSQGFDSESMKKAAEKLTDKEINDISLYLSQQEIPKEKKKDDNKTDEINKDFID